MTNESRRDPPGSPNVFARGPNTHRRRFLLFGAGAAGAAAAAPVLAGPAAVVEPVAEAPRSQGYQETEHVRDYYASTRL